MSDLKGRLDRMTRRFSPPDDWFDGVQRRRRQRQRRRRAGAVAASILLLAGAAVPLARWADRGSEIADGPTGPWRTIFEHNFHARAAAMAWPPTIDRPAVRTVLSGGRFDVLVARPFDHRYWVLGGSATLEEIRVDVSTLDVRLPGSHVLDGRALTGEPDAGFRGVMCVSETRPVDAYVFAVDPSDGTYLISRIVDGGPPVVLRQGTVALPADPVRATTIDATCRRAPGRTDLAMDVHGVRLAVSDDDPLGPFRGAGIYLESRGAPAAAAFDRIAFSVPA